MMHEIRKTGFSEELTLVTGFSKCGLPFNIFFTKIDWIEKLMATPNWYNLWITTFFVFY